MTKNNTKKNNLLGVNIDHVATLRQQRLAKVPDLKKAALEAIRGGADQITMHLREDRRHIQDSDLTVIKRAIKVPLNLEMALNEEIVLIAKKLRPEKVCLVPEKRKELTTEGGLDVVKNAKRLKRVIADLQSRRIQVSLFIDPIIKQVQKAADLGADAIELHTGRYAEVSGKKRQAELARIQKAAKLGFDKGLIVHAGHGLDLNNIGPINRIKEISELNIGFSIVADALFVGLYQAVKQTKQVMNKTR